MGAAGSASESASEETAASAFKAGRGGVFEGVEEEEGREERVFFFEFFSSQDRWSIDVFRFSRFSPSLRLTALARTAHRSAQAVEHLESLAHVGEKEKSDALRERTEGATMGTGESKRKQKKSTLSLGRRAKF